MSAAIPSAWRWRRWVQGAAEPRYDLIYLGELVASRATADEVEQSLLRYLRADGCSTDVEIVDGDAGQLIAMVRV